MAFHVGTRSVLKTPNENVLARNDTAADGDSSAVGQPEYCVLPATGPCLFNDMLTAANALAMYQPG
jgi:hypothetical protein